MMNLNNTRTLSEAHPLLSVAARMVRVMSETMILNAREGRPSRLDVSGLESLCDTVSERCGFDAGSLRLALRLALRMHCGHSFDEACEDVRNG